MTTSDIAPVALVTGGSAGLGLALTHALAARGWTVVIDGRDAERVERAAASAPSDSVIPVPGNITEEWHRAALLEAVERLGRLDLLVHNASTLGPTPLRPLTELTIEDLAQVWRTNAGAPLVLTADLVPHLVAARGTLLSISSDAAVEHYEGWGLYGASKAGLDHITLTYAAENPQITGYAVDPGDMRTQLHQDAFPGEDISDRPLPDEVVPHLLALLDAAPPSGRYRAAEFATRSVDSERGVA